MRLADALQAALRARFEKQRDGDQAHRRASRCVRWFEAEGIRRPTVVTLRRLVAAMREAGLGPATINRHLSALSVVLGEAGLELELPWQREPRGRTRVLSRGEVATLAAACLQYRHGKDVSSLVLFLGETGLRVGEALALTWQDVEGDGVRVRTSKNGDGR